MPKARTHFPYFKGLNALRFLAASLVILMHIRSNQITQGLAALPDWPIFFKGLTAVSFFFVLSGFLITYILLKEIETTGSINIKNFYLKRVYRIWPLYFIIVGFGLLFYWYLAPKLGLQFDIDYSKGLALLLYTFFGANLLNSLFHVGGILHVTWSIAVEEQFYLFWAPVVKKFKSNIKLILLMVLIVSITINTLNAFNIFELEEGWQRFVHTLQFHYMAMGGWVAFLLFQNAEKLLSKKIFSSKIVQLIILAFIGWLFLGYHKSEILEPLLILPSGFSFAWLIVNVSVNPNKIFGLDNKVFNYLGEISYGIYMYHMIVVYAVTFLSSKLLSDLPFAVLQSVYILSVFSLTIILSAASYRFLESKILLKGRQFIKQL